MPHSFYSPRRLVFFLIGMLLVIKGSVLFGFEEQGRGALEFPTTKAGSITTARLLNMTEEAGNWLTGGRDYQQTYYSPLETINKKNIKNLGFAWEYKIDSTAGFEATPIVVDGMMFTSGPRGAVYALDAKTGKEIWHFELEVGQIDSTVFRKAASGSGINRGVAVWKGVVYVASIDGFLYALDAASGEVKWRKDTFVDRQSGYVITGAPYVAKQVVVIGNGGSEFGARGYVSAYDIQTGQLRWRFFTVPGDPAKGFEHSELAVAAKTWDPNSTWESGLGGTAWDGMAYDPMLNLLYVGVGNGGPFPQAIRSPGGGDNLFLSSILALNPDDGRLVWHYQTTPGDSWDYTATQKMILADIELDGKVRQVIMQAPKNGFFYVLDRVTGELLSAEPYTTVTWASHVDMNTGRPVKTEQSDYSKEPKLIFPSIIGGHNWQPMSYNPKQGLVYIPAIEQAVVLALQDTPFVFKKGGAMNLGAEYYYAVAGPKGEDRKLAQRAPLKQLSKGQPDTTSRGFLRAWDPVTQALVWEVETSDNFVGTTFATWNGGGVMTTGSGLVFQGRGTGDLVVLDTASGEMLHRIEMGTSMSAAPMTYSVDGEQYIAIMAGLGGVMGTSPPEGTAAYKYGNKGRIIALKLDGGKVPHPAELTRSLENIKQPAISRHGTLIEQEAGRVLFEQHCSVCHINNRGSGIPDLRLMSAQTHDEFLDIVLKGIRAERGMSSFDDILTPKEAATIHLHLIELAWKLYEQVTVNHSDKPEGSVRKSLKKSIISEDTHRVK